MKWVIAITTVITLISSNINLDNGPELVFKFNDSFSGKQITIEENEIDSIKVYSPLSCLIYITDNKLELLKKIDPRNQLINTEIDGWVNGGVELLYGDSSLLKIGYRDFLSSETPYLFINTDSSKLNLHKNYLMIVSRDSAKNPSKCILGDLFYEKMYLLGKIKP